MELSSHKHTLIFLQTQKHGADCINLKLKTPSTMHFFYKEERKGVLFIILLLKSFIYKEERKIPPV